MFANGCEFCYVFIHEKNQTLVSAQYGLEIIFKCHPL